MKINKKLALLMMTVTVSTILVTGCGQTSNNNTNGSVGTTDSVDDDADDNDDVNDDIDDNDVNDDADDMNDDVNDDTDDVNDDADDNDDDEMTEQDPSVAQEVTFVITDGIEMPATLEMPADLFNDAYGINTDLLQSYSVKMPMMNVHADEIAVFELKDEADIDEVKAGINKRKEALEAQWSTYLPEQYDLVKDAQVVVKDNLVLFVISPNSETIIEKFNTL